ncbi:ubiquinone anaerobic biosynthesis accessory factor UbiT [Sphingosinicella rhizophila]|uniref:SCP2 sterol-binding domain-containing protein n=1 Tax=Sphingosinicella rhizophila TaxID=3050082 RepID=A0ABU3QBU6_9SPHN|nr:SCP2 sterol-binding domain-containing protein [Sphingosinicella sp. GR2756]MDT9600871.1 SCP2 sterol-binding domain-containing protein [Sphingosinicella sp. GR2756]
MIDQTTMNAVPVAAHFFLRRLPLFPLHFALRRMARSVGRRRPGLFDRLGAHADKLFLVDPTDLPFVLRFHPRPTWPTIEPRRRERAGAWDARIAGSLGALAGMIQGNVDGDALFFSRDIIVEGDIEAVLALRNALDDAEIDLIAEAAALLGPAGGTIRQVAHRFLPPAARLLNRAGFYR